MSVQKSPTSLNGHQILSPSNDISKSPNQCTGPGSLPFSNNITKQITKLKRFFSTLLSFGCDIDTNTGDIVKNLVFSLLCNRITVEQFQSKLQQATHFPLKAFVTPFIKATLPLLQQEIILCSQILHQTPENFLLHNRDYLNLADSNKNENILESSKMFYLKKINKDSKDSEISKSPDASFDPLNNVGNTNCTNYKNSIKKNLTIKLDRSDVSDFKGKDVIPSPKTTAPLSSWRPMLVSVSNVSEPVSQNILNQPSSTISWMNLHQNSAFIDSISSSKHKSFNDKLHQHWDQILSHITNFQPSSPNRITPFQFPTTECEIISGIDDIIKLGEEHQKHLIHQLKNIQDAIRRQKEENNFSDVLHGNRNFNSNDLTNIKRCAVKYYDDAVHEVQRVAQLELRRTITSLQGRTIELIEQEKARFQFIIEEMKRQCKEEYNRLLLKQDEGPENCYNCGRKATEACSICKTTRYCGRFCQQKDWNKHKNKCSQHPGPVCKKTKFENIDVHSNSSKSPEQIDPENLSLKSNTYQCSDLNIILKSVQNPPNMSSQSLIQDISQDHNSVDEQHPSDDILLIDV